MRARVSRMGSDTGGAGVGRTCRKHAPPRPGAPSGPAVWLLLTGLVAWQFLPGPAQAQAQAQAQAVSEAEARLKAAETAASTGASLQAVRLATEAIEQNPALAEAYYLRGREHFRLGNMKKSIADFDRLIELRPGLASRQWERGIACYYAGRFDEGAEQFALYQSFHDNDVENSVWRYLCMARQSDAETARQAMLPIKNDPRVPMMEIYRLYRGELKPADVLAAVDRDEPSAEVRAGRLFYARLYLGLYHEVNGQQELARKYILAAAKDQEKTRRINRYMGDVARIHARKFAPNKPQKPDKPQKFAPDTP